MTANEKYVQECMKFHQTVVDKDGVKQYRIKQALNVIASVILLRKVEGAATSLMHTRDLKNMLTKYEDALVEYMKTTS